MTDIFLVAIIDAMEKVAANYGGTHEEMIHADIKKHQRRADRLGGYGKAEKKHRRVGAAVGAGLGAITGAMVGTNPVKPKGSHAAIGAGAGAALGGGIGYLSGRAKGKERSARAKRVAGMSPQEKKRYLSQLAAHDRHRDSQNDHATTQALLMMRD